MIVTICIMILYWKWILLGLLVWWLVFVYLPNR